MTRSILLVLGIAAALLLRPLSPTLALWGDGVSVPAGQSTAGTAQAPSLSCRDGILGASVTVSWPGASTVPGDIYSSTASGAVVAVVALRDGFEAVISEGLLGGLLKSGPVPVVVTVLAGTSWAQSSTVVLSRGPLGAGLYCPSR